MAKRLKKKVVARAKVQIKPRKWLKPKPSQKLSLKAIDPSIVQPILDERTARRLISTQIAKSKNESSEESNCLENYAVLVFCSISQHKAFMSAMENLGVAVRHEMYYNGESVAKAVGIDLPLYIPPKQRSVRNELLASMVDREAIEQLKLPTRRGVITNGEEEGCQGLEEEGCQEGPEKEACQNKWQVGITNPDV